MLFSLIIPCFNEAANLPLVVDRCRRLVETPGIEVVLVDNGSSDDTPTVMARLLDGQSAIRSIRVPINQGYGHGVLSGLRAAKGDILGWTHADMQTDPVDFLAAKDIFDAASEPSRLFVKGRRYGRTLGDVLFTASMALFESALLRKPMWDINAQPTVFPRMFLERWSEPPKDFSLDLYVYFLALHSSLTVRRFPVRFSERVQGMSHWNVDWAAKRRFIRRTIGYSLRLRRTLPQS